MNPGFLLLLGVGLGISITFFMIGIIGILHSYRVPKRTIRLYGNSSYAPRAVNHDVLS